MELQMVTQQEKVKLEGNEVTKSGAEASGMVTGA